MPKSQASEAESLDEKIKRIRKKNEEIEKRRLEVEADKQTAAKLNALVQLSAPKEDWPPPRSYSPEEERNKKTTSSVPEKVKENSRGNASFRDPVAEANRPPPDPVYRFLADAERDPLPPSSQERPSRAPRGGRGSAAARGRGRDFRRSDGPPMGRGQPSYDAWRAERNRIDEERIRRQRTAQGQWRREWDNQKSEDDWETVKNNRQQNKEQFQPHSFRRPAQTFGPSDQQPHHSGAAGWSGAKSSPSPVQSSRTEHGPRGNVASNQNEERVIQSSGDSIQVSFSTEPPMVTSTKVLPRKTVGSGRLGPPPKPRKSGSPKVRKSSSSASEDAYQLQTAPVVPEAQTIPGKAAAPREQRSRRSRESRARRRPTPKKEVAVPKRKHSGDGDESWEDADEFSDSVDHPEMALTQRAKGSASEAEREEASCVSKELEDTTSEIPSCESFEAKSATVTQNQQEEPVPITLDTLTSSEDAADASATKTEDPSESPNNRQGTGSTPDKVEHPTAHLTSCTDNRFVKDEQNEQVEGNAEDPGERDSGDEPIQLHAQNLHSELELGGTVSNAVTEVSSADVKPTVEVQKIDNVKTAIPDSPASDQREIPGIIVKEHVTEAVCEESVTAASEEAGPESTSTETKENTEGKELEVESSEDRNIENSKNQLEALEEQKATLEQTAVNSVSHMEETNPTYEQVDKVAPADVNENPLNTSGPKDIKEHHAEDGKSESVSKILEGMLENDPEKNKVNPVFTDKVQDSPSIQEKGAASHEKLSSETAAVADVSCEHESTSKCDPSIASLQEHSTDQVTVMAEDSGETTADTATFINQAATSENDLQPVDSQMA